MKPCIESLESKLLLDGGLTSFSLNATSNSQVAQVAPPDPPSTVTVPVVVSSLPALPSVSYVPLDSLDTTQQNQLDSVSTVVPAPNPVVVLPDDSFVGPPPAYTGYPGINTLNPDHPFGGYGNVYADNPAPVVIADPSSASV